MINIEEMRIKTRALNDLLDNPKEGDKDWQHAVAALAGSIEEGVASIRGVHDENMFSGVPVADSTLRDLSMWSPTSS